MSGPVFSIIADRGRSLAVDDIEPHAGGRAIRIASCLDGVMLDDAKVGELIKALTVWKHAPRDAARASAEVVASERMVDVVIDLLKTSMGEWGVRTTYSDEDATTDLRWYAGDAAERSARSLYDELLGSDRVTCDGCEKSIAIDDATDHGDGYYCEACAEAAAAEFKASRWSCTSTACGWNGTGPEVAREEDDMSCPKCGEYVEETSQEGGQR